VKGILDLFEEDFISLADLPGRSMDHGGTVSAHYVGVAARMRA
jgi:hypothetical protein